MGNGAGLTVATMTSLLAFPKAAQVPKAWLDVEGVTKKQDPGEKPPAGATVQYPGVFTILDKGTVEWGVQLPWFKEFFLNGNKWKGRWAFRLVRREGEKHITPECAEDMGAFKQRDVLPEGVEEEDARTEGYFILMQPLDATPYVLGGEAVRKGTLPPYGVSALPHRIRSKVPKELRFWEMKDRAKAKQARDALAGMEEIAGTELEGSKLLVLGQIGEDSKGRWVTIRGKPVYIEGKGYSGSARFGSLSGTSVARAEADGNIVVDESRWNELDSATQRFVLAHEIAHHTVEDFVLKDNDEWNLAEESLTIAVSPDGRKLFAGGNTRIDESVSDSVAAHLRDSRFGNMSDQQWNTVTEWAEGVINRAGYETSKLQNDVDRLFSELED